MFLTGKDRQRLYANTGKGCSQVKEAASGTHFTLSKHSTVLMPQQTAFTVDFFDIPRKFRGHKHGGLPDADAVSHLALTTKKKTENPSEFIKRDNSRNK